MAVSVCNDLDLWSSLGRVATLSIPELVHRPISICADQFPLRKDSLLEEARVGLGSSVALVAVADEQSLAISANVDGRIVALLQRDVEEDELSRAKREHGH